MPEILWVVTHQILPKKEKKERPDNSFIYKRTGYWLFLIF